LFYFRLFSFFGDLLLLFFKFEFIEPHLFDEVVKLALKFEFFVWEVGVAEVLQTFDFYV